jgi:hypothetical protein
MAGHIPRQEAGALVGATFDCKSRERQPGLEAGVATRRPAGPTGWAIFAGIVLFIAGWLNFFFGLAGIVNDEVVTVQGRGVIIWDFTAWGWIHLILGVLMFLTACGLFAAQGWARGMAVVFAALNAIAQIGLISAFPLFSITMIALDVIVIYQLTARWEPAAPGP